ncbi:MAG TPA: ABC transporter permease [Sedimenticola thiotaurini]|uniref:ABC transporter permease n=1 Tax=Sedimenticola thiotaurini TaxID=1543721 RepID=A0A831RMF4_9GAMM|nr:ABC transporter permease [Sedimenticola thiotaurini]
MISLAYRDVANGFGRYLATGLGLGLLIGVTLTMAGVYRGMVDDGKALLRSAGADIWVVQQNTLGPFAEPSSLPDGMRRGVLAIPGVKEAGNVAYLTLEVTDAGTSVRIMLAGYEPGRPGGPRYLIAGRHITRSHYELVADVRTGFQVGDVIPIRRHDYTVVGLTAGLRSPSGDPMVFLPLRDAQEIQFLKDNDAVFRDRRQLQENPQLNPPSNPSLLGAVEASLFSNDRVNAILVRLLPGYDEGEVAAEIRDWLRLTAYTSAEMEEILIGQLIATASRQIGLFLVILTIVSAAIVALTIYSMTQTKLKEIAVLKLIGTPNRLISGMIVQEAMGLGLIGFIAGKLAVTYWAPLFPKHVVLLEQDTLVALGITLVICLVASIAGVRSAVRVSPGSAIGG